MTTVRAGEVQFKLYPQDHEPRHAHGLIGSGEVIVALRADRTVALADREDGPTNVTRNEVRRVLKEAANHFDELVAAWEKMHQ